MKFVRHACGDHHINEATLEVVKEEDEEEEEVVMKSLPAQSPQISPLEAQDQEETLLWALIPTEHLAGWQTIASHWSESFDPVRNHTTVSAPAWLDTRN